MITFGRHSSLGREAQLMELRDSKVTGVNVGPPMVSSVNANLRGFALPPTR